MTSFDATVRSLRLPLMFPRSWVSALLGVWLAAPLGLVAEGLPDPQAVRLDQLGLMQGFPPPAQAQITRDNYLLNYPNSRWAFHHMRELLPSRNIARGLMPPSLLPTGESLRERIDALVFVGPDDQRLSFAQYLRSSYADATLIMKDGQVIYEAYHQGMPAESPHMLWSLSKSLLGVLAAQLLVEGVLDEQMLVSDYIPELKHSGWAGATLRQVLDMTAEVAYSETDLQSDVLQYGFAAGLLPTPAQYAGPQDIYSYLASIEAGGEHGEGFVYRTVHTEVLGWIMRRATGMSLAQLFSERLWQPMGAEQDGYLLLDRLGTEWAGAGFNATLRDLARFAEMMRQDGRFNGQQIISPEVIADLRRGADQDAFIASGRDYQPGYSYRNQWWVSHNPDGVYEALGAYGQLLHINPEAGLVVVRLSSHPLAPSAHTFATTRLAMQALADLLR
ncbi:hypothetical protein BVH74_14960 [Halopseudomonas phragmitis]|uniref:Beta-lactamase-related domain-containing protein n=2 Tax=Halopseudomonas phragmitis TaxID=1931241 RepID=A0A1V0B7V5_9GAMM|nr:hypothetical protein BVH74_14960 [Halopseudomonas phragmitis]